MYSIESRASDDNKDSRNSLNKDRTPNCSHRGPYLSLIETNTLLDGSVDTGSKQTESGLLVVGHELMPSASDDLLINGSIGIDKVRHVGALFLGNTSLEMMMARTHLAREAMTKRGPVVIPDFPHVYIKWDDYRQKLVITILILPSSQWGQGLQLLPLWLVQKLDCLNCV
jgi:hypothetical protein